MARKKAKTLEEQIAHGLAWKRKNEEERDKIRGYLYLGYDLRKIKKMMPDVSESCIRNHIDNIENGY